MCFAIASDCLSSYFKYNSGSNGFACTPYPGNQNLTVNGGVVTIFSKAKYTADNLVLVTNSDALLEAAFITKVSGFFLALAALNRLSEKYVGATFMTMCEYRVYCLYSLASVPLYPILQGVYHDDAKLTTVAPQVVYHCECMVLFILFAVMAFRMKVLLNETTTASEYGKQRMGYMIGVVCLLSFLNLLDSIGLGVININVLMNRVDTTVTLYTMTTLDGLTTLFSFSFAPSFGVAFLIIVTDDDEELMDDMVVKPAAAAVPLPITTTAPASTAVEMSAQAPAVPSNNPLSA